MTSYLTQEDTYPLLQENNDFLLFSAFTIFVNNTDVTEYVTMSSYVKTDTLYSSADVLRFEVMSYVGQEYAPSVNDEVTVFDEDEKIFGGYIMSVEKTVDLALNIVTHSIVATDYGQLLNKQLIIERLENTTVNDVISYLLTKYYPDFDDLYVDAPIDVTSITFNNISVSQALEKLTRLTSYSWYVDYDKHVHFFAKNSVAAPFNITDRDGNYIPDTMNVSHDLTQIKNRITVKGGEIEVSDVTFDMVGSQGKIEDNGNTIFDVSYKFSKKPIVSVNSVEKTVGIVGFDTDETMFDAMWSSSQKYLTFMIYIAPSDVVTVSGTPLETIQVRVQDSASIAAYGRCDAVFSVPGIKTREEALQYAEAQKTMSKNPEVTCKFSTYVSGLRSGQTLNITSDQFGISEDFIVQRVSHRKLTNNRNIWDVELSTTRQITLISLLSDILGAPEVAELSAEALLAYLEIADVATTVDGGPVVTSKTGPYQVWPNSGSGTGSAAIVNFSTVSA